MKIVYENEYQPRTTMPTKDNVRFTCKDNGGWSPCIDGSPSAWKGSVMANCVGYAFGRFAEIGDMTASECKLGRVAGVSYPQSASVWWNKRSAMGYESGQVAKLGACGCWIKKSGGTGHVMICEKIYDDGSILISGSSYNGEKFYTKKLDKNYNYGSLWTFQGWIYNPCVKPSQYPMPVERNEKVHQYEVTIDALYWRKGCGKTYDKYNDFVEMGIYNVLEQYNDGSYIWNKIADNYWFAGAYADGSDKHGIDYPVEDDVAKLKKQIEELNKQIKEQNATIEDLNETIASQKKKLEDIQVVLDR